MALTLHCAKSALDEQRNQIIASMYQEAPALLETPVRRLCGTACRAAQHWEGNGQAGRNAISARASAPVAQHGTSDARAIRPGAFVISEAGTPVTNQGAASNNLANRLGDLSQGLATFAESMGTEAWRHTVVAVISEFGRTFREAAARGTDHGRSGLLVSRRRPRLPKPAARCWADRSHRKAAVPEPRLPVLNGYRSCSAACLRVCLARHSAASAADLSDVPARPGCS